MTPYLQHAVPDPALGVQPVDRPHGTPDDTAGELRQGHLSVDALRRGPTQGAHSDTHPALQVRALATEPALRELDATDGQCQAPAGDEGPDPLYALFDEMVRGYRNLPGLLAACIREA